MWIWSYRVSALVIDASSWIDYFASGHNAAAIEDALADGRVYLPPIVAAELLSGELDKRDLGALESLLKDLPLCDTSIEHWFRVGRLRCKLLTAGETVSTPDAHVAQCAIDLAATLMSEDRVFQRMAKRVGLRLFY
jgi:predicted nucleic acid-binding protein